MNTTLITTSFSGSVKNIHIFVKKICILKDQIFNCTDLLSFFLHSLNQNQVRKLQHSKDSFSSKSLHKMQIPHILLLEGWDNSKTQTSFLFSYTHESWGEGCLHTSIPLHIQRPLYNCFINYSWPLRKRTFKFHFFLKSLLLINVQLSHHCPLFSQVKFSLEQN